MQASIQKAESIKPSGFSRAWLLVFSLLLGLPISANAQVTFEQKSNPAGLFTSTSATKNINDSISTITPSLTINEYSFTHWTLNDVRENAPDGQAKNKISATITENTVAIAHYLATNQDSDSDGVPDWFEIRMFATLDHNGSYDGDGDGVSLADERQFGLAATIADDFLEGGASIRRSGLVFANFGGAKKLSVSSDPAGLFTSSETFPETNSSYSSTNLNGLTNGYYFSHWEVNGVRQADSKGIGLSKISLTMNEDKSVVAKYYHQNEDTDSDGLPDWFEWHEFGTLDHNSSSDPDGDGLLMSEERQFGLSAVITDDFLEGGASIRRSGLVFANFGGAKKLSVSSDPAGLFTSSETFPETNSSYSSTNLNGLTNGYYFSHWEVNGVRQADSKGIGLSKISLTMNEDKTVVAKYYHQNEDTDSDGLPDWFEWHEFGTLDHNSSSDPDGDGLLMSEERQFGLSAVIADDFLEGGGSIRRSGTFGYIEFQPNEDDDGDGLTKAQELQYGTSDDNTDSDGDGFPDGEEVAYGSSPTDANSIANGAPVDLNLSNNFSFMENLPIGSIIGDFNGSDPDGDQMTYFLISGLGDGNNSLFSLETNGSLKTATTFDFETNSSNYSIRVQAKDSYNQIYDANFTLTLLDDVQEDTDNDGYSDVIEQDQGSDPDDNTSFPGTDYRNADLSNFSSSYKTDKYANFEGTNLTGKQLQASDFTGGNFRNANLTNASVRWGAKFHNANLTNTNFSGANIRGTDFNNTNLDTANLSRAWFDHTTIWPEGFDFLNSGAFGPGVDFRELDLSNFSASYVIATNTNFEGTNLTGKQLQASDFTGGNFRNANLTSASVRWGAKFHNANLTNTNFSGANIRGTDFNNTNLDTANLAGAWFDDTTIWPEGFDFLNSGAFGPRVDFRSLDLSNFRSGPAMHANFEGTNLTGKHLQTSDYTGANFRNANLTNTLARGSTFHNTNLTNTNFSGANLSGSTFTGAIYNENTIWPDGFDPVATGAISRNNPKDLNSTALLAFSENQPIGTIIGEFNATDPDGHAITYHFVSGENNNSLFTLDTNGTLKTATTFDYESNATSYTITVQAKDELNATIEGNFTVTLLDVYEDTDGDGFRDSLEASTGSNLNDPNSTPLQQGLVAWYPFDGNASDMSGNGNHGTVNGATLGTDRHGVEGKAYSFDGVDDWIDLNKKLLEENFSLCFWAKIETSHQIQSGEQGFALYSTYTHLGGLIVFYLPSNGGYLNFRFNDGSSNTHLNFGGNDSSADVTKWNKIFLSKNEKAALFFNSKLVQSVDVNSFLSPSSFTGGSNTGECIGKASWYDGEYFSGFIDDVRIYDRALSSDEISLLYNLEKPKNPPRDLNSVAALSFTENQRVDTIIGEFNATDPDGHAITYSLVPFSPTHLSPALWFDASDEATLIKESGVLNSWLDKSGHYRNGSSTGSSRPSISTGYNGYSMINLDGVDDIVSINGSFALNTFFVVLNSEISSEKFSKWAWVFGARGPNKTFQMVPALYGVMGDSSLSTELPFQGNRQSVISFNGDDTLSQNTKDLGNFSEFKLISVSSNQSSSNLSNWKISSGEFPWMGNIAEIVAFDRPLEGHQRYNIEEYLSSKWGLSSKMYRPYVPSNSLFTLDTNGTLKTATTFDYESNASTYTITVQAKDELNATTEGNFTVTLLDVYEDTDGDGFRDSLEASTGSNLNDPNSTPLQQGLVAWYPFDGNASDMSGNGNHGTVNGATLGTDRHGVAGKAYIFDGVDDRIELEHGNILGDAQKLTLSAWIKTSLEDGGPVFGEFAVNSSNQYQYTRNFFSVRGNLVINFDQFPPSEGISEEARQNYVLADSWNHITYSRNGSSWYITIGSSIVSSGSQSENYNGPTPQSAWIGARKYDVDNPTGIHGLFQGSIDDIRIYDRALSADEIEMLYRAESPNHFVDSAKDLEMIWVEPGTFTMGQTGVTNAEPEHNVTLTKGFYLGKYEVTQTQYEAVMDGVTGDLNATPSNWPNNPNRPVEMVSWNDIQVFLSLLNQQQEDNLPPGWAYVLPTEAQWEYACRAGTTNAYSWGDTISASDANWNHGNDANQTEDVGQSSANPWGFFDMHGNVWEWTADAYGAYASGVQTDPFNAGEPSSNRVFRGSSWYNPGSALRSASRSNSPPGARTNTRGFRLALRDLNEAPTDLNSIAVLTVQENQPVGTIIGEFNVTDPDGHAITYHFISGENNNSLFVLDTNGTLKTATTFDYESNASSYIINIQAKDELNATTEGNFTITLQNVVEDNDKDGVEDHYDLDDDNDGFSDAEELAYGSDPRSSATLPLNDSNFMSAIALWFDAERNATALYGHISDWNVSSVTNMTGAFRFRMDFNEDISKWDTSSVSDMRYMFNHARAFNQAIGEWNTSKVINMQSMFTAAYSFNQYIGDWNTSLVQSMSSMFKLAKLFNQDISKWDTSKVAKMGRMFDHALVFNQPIGEWNVSSVTSLSQMFRNAVSFNQPIGNWDTSSVKNMEQVFDRASSFDQDVSNWDIRLVSDMIQMFNSANSLSVLTKREIHRSFSANQNWSYDWSPHIANSTPVDLNITSELSVTENNAVGLALGKFTASDPEGDAITFSLAPRVGSEVPYPFQMEQNGTLRAAKSFDYETDEHNYTITVVAKDEYNATTEGNFTVTIIDQNDAPYDLNATAPLRVLENQPVGTIVGKLTAKDQDQGDQLTYKLVRDREQIDNELFSLDENGTLSTAATFDFEKNQTFHIRVKVLDQSGLMAKESFYISVINIVEDLDGDGIEDAYDEDIDGDGFSNEEESAYGSDPFDKQSVANAAPDLLELNGTTIKENQPVGTKVGQFRIGDPDGNTGLTLKLLNREESVFGLDDNGTLRAKKVFDYESDEKNFTVSVRLSDEHNFSLQKTFLIAVEDVDDTAPVINLNGDRNITHEAGFPYYDANATWSDAVDGTGQAQVSGEIDTSTPGVYVLSFDYTDDAGNEAETITRRIEVVDSTAPVIVLNGDNNITHEAGFAYHDANATWSDTVDGEGVLYGVGDVNVSRPGIYVLRFNYSDQAGNSAETLMRTVRVIDTIAPMINLIGDSNITHPAMVPYVDQGAVWEDLADGWGKAFAFGEVDVTKPGTYTVVYSAKDKSGNIASEVRRQVNVVDTDYPIITLRGDSLIVHEAGTEYIDEGAIWNDSVDGSGDALAQGVVDSTMPGTYSITYSKVDSSGNAAETITRTIEVVDSTAPVIKLNGDSNITHEAGFAYNDTNATWSDTVDGEGVVYGVGDVNVSQPGIYVLRFNYSDEAGNQAAVVKRMVHVVNTPPKTPQTNNVLEILENQPIGTVIGQFHSTDRNGDPLTFHLKGQEGALQPSPFFINKQGVLKNRLVLDYETNASEYQIGVVVRDPHGGRADANFTVKLFNVVEDFDEDGQEDHYDPDDDNDGFSDVDELAYGSDPFDSQSVINHAPEGILMEGGEIEENQPAGTVVARFMGVDVDEDDNLTYRMVAPAQKEAFPFDLTPSGVLKSKNVLDYEVDEHNYSIRVRVSDDRNTSFEKSFTLYLRNQIEDIDGDEIEDFYDEDIDGDGFTNEIELSEGTDPRNPYSLPMLPMLETLSGYSEENGSIVLHGRLLSNGGGKVSGFGFALSSQVALGGNDSEHKWIQGKGSPDQFSLRLEDYPFEGDFYFRAWAKNVAGTGLGTVKKVSIEPEPTSWWGEIEELAGGWKKSNWFGTFRSYENGWIYHAQLGWIYASRMDDGSAWLWKEQKGWLWTQEDVWPYLWSNFTGSWIYLYPGLPGSTPQFFDFNKIMLQE